MGISLTHPTPPPREITAGERMERLGALTSKQCTDALLWLSGYAPAVFDEVVDAVQPCSGDGTDDPAPFCDHCGADIGIFLKLGLDWRHYRGTLPGPIELYDPGHAPVLAWRITAPAAT
jgi:hypothetical protein